MVDIVIPLSTESQCDNDELRLALRSIDKYAINKGNIWVYTDAKLPWAKNINIIPFTDSLKNCKDVNLFNKILAAANNPDVSERFMFWSDDQLLTAPLDLEKAPVVYNDRPRSAFTKQKNKWYTRMIHTFDWLENQGIKLNHNFDAHTPEPYKKEDVKYVFNTAPYKEQPGFCINTLYYGLLRHPGDVMQASIKVTAERPEHNLPGTLLTYLGYSDHAFYNGLRHFIRGYLFQPCQYLN